MTETPRKLTAIGILGGSFDPIHNGHLYLAEEAGKAVALDRLILVPALLPPHKTSRKITAPEHRLAMIRLAIRDRSWLRLDEAEIRRGGISYTVETVRNLEEAHPGAKLYFLTGSDSLKELWTWRDIGEIVKKVTFIVARRRDEEPATSHPEPEAELGEVPLRTILLPSPPLPLSSTDIRERLALGLSVRDMVPPAVADYIAAHRLYGAS